MVFEDFYIKLQCLLSFVFILREPRNHSKQIILTKTTDSFNNVTFEETIVASSHQGNKLMRKFISNPVTRSIFDDRKSSERSTLREYDTKSEIEKPSSVEEDTTGFQVNKELVIPRAITEGEEVIEKMSEEELLREYEDISNQLKHNHIKLERRV